MHNMFEELGSKFEEKLLKVAAHFVEAELLIEDDKISTRVPVSLADDKEIEIEYSTSRSYSTTVQINEQELQKWKKAYQEDPHFSQVLKAQEGGKETDTFYSQYHHSEDGLIYFEDSTGNT